MSYNNDSITFYYEKMNETLNEMKVNRLNIYSGIGVLKEHFQNFYELGIQNSSKLKNIEQEFKTIDLSTKDTIYQDLNNKIFQPLSKLLLDELQQSQSKTLKNSSYLDKLKDWQERILKC